MQSNTSTTEQIWVHLQKPPNKKSTALSSSSSVPCAVDTGLCEESSSADDVSDARSTSPMLAVVPTAHTALPQAQGSASPHTPSSHVARVALPEPAMVLSRPASARHSSSHICKITKLDADPVDSMVPHAGSSLQGTVIQTTGPFCDLLSSMKKSESGQGSPDFLGGCTLPEGGTGQTQRASLKLGGGTSFLPKGTLLQQASSPDKQRQQQTRENQSERTSGASGVGSGTLPSEAMFNGGRKPWLQYPHLGAPTTMYAGNSSAGSGVDGSTSPEQSPQRMHAATAPCLDTCTSPQRTPHHFSTISTTPTSQRSSPSSAVATSGRSCFSPGATHTQPSKRLQGQTGAHGEVSISDPAKTPVSGAHTTRRHGLWAHPLADPMASMPGREANNMP